MYVPEWWAHVTKITSFTAVRVRVELRTYKCIIIRQGVQFCSLCATLRDTKVAAQVHADTSLAVGAWPRGWWCDAGHARR